MSFSLESIAQRIGGELDGPSGLEIRGVAGLEEAREGELSFLARSRYRPQLRSTGASAVILKRGEEFDGPSIRVDDPYLSFLQAIELFARPTHELFEAGIHPTANIHESVLLGSGVRIGPFSSIAPGCSIGDGSIVGPNSVLMHGVTIGPDCLIYPRVTIREECELGARVIVHSGAVVGSDGFGFAKTDGSYKKIPQIGNVVIEDDVEIGANSCIDRATTGRTVIAAGAKLDNLVQIAHNVRVGENTVISAQSGISGSSRIGSDVVLAGQVGISGHIEIGDGVQIGGKSGISGNVPEGSVISGIPARDHREWRKLNAHYGRLGRYAEEIAAMRKRIEQLERKRDAETTENA
jgi:UDP-3-O-[3-hydroxymyristoyl] glucosamine N-acyltransferase